MAVAGSRAHSDIVIGPLRPDPATSFWNRNGSFLRRISLETGNTVGEVFSSWGAAHEIDFSPDGIYLLQLTKDGNIRVYDMELGIDLGKLADQSGDIATMRETSAGEWVTHGKAGITKVWDFDFLDVASHFDVIENLVPLALLAPEGHALRATIIPPDALANEAPRGAIIFTPDGYYSGDRSRLAELSFGDASGPINFEQFDLIANRPDITLSRLGLVSEADRLRLFEAVRKRQARYSADGAPAAVRVPADGSLRVSVGLGEGVSRVTEAELIPIKISLDTAHAVSELVIRVNGTPVLPV